VIRGKDGRVRYSRVVLESGVGEERSRLVMKNNNKSQELRVEGNRKEGARRDVRKITRER
jgi:hypothetical protein